MSGGRLRFAARRIAWALVVIVGVTSVAFLMANVLPGDPARMLVGPQASAEDVLRAREVYGLDRPLLEQYGRFWTRMLHFGPDVEDARANPAPSAGTHRSCASIGLGVHLDLGFSFQYRKPVVDVLAAKIPRSFELALAALAVQLVLGVALGTSAAARRGSRWDDAAIGTALLGVSAPTFVIGLFLQYVLAYKLRWLPYDGYGSTPSEQLASMVLPALTLGLYGTAMYARIVRDELIDILARDHVRTAVAKGASRTRALLVHGLRNALVPVATLAALDLGTLVGGAIVTEQVFRWPGVGQMAVYALQNRDGPLIIGTVVFASTAVVLVTLVLDLSYAFLDPRLRTNAARPRSA